MIFFINLLRLLAMCLITNSHYRGVYPTDLIANGGLLGDVLFFAVSGFCLSNIRQPFHKWYVKRIFRIYPIIWLALLFFLVIGQYKITSASQFFSYYVFPTRYHFIGSIILLYIPYYIFAYSSKKLSGSERFNNGKLTLGVMTAVAAVWLAVYFTVYDKTYYHIDNVREPMIAFLYFEAMLTGFYFKERLEYFKNKKGIVKWLVTAVLFCVYFISKLAFSKKPQLSQLQFLNQIILLALMAGIFICTASLSDRLDKLPEPLKKTVNYLSAITLEVYAMQFMVGKEYIIIVDAFRKIAFPLNWLIITAVIIAGAAVLHCIVKAPSAIHKKLKEKNTD